MSRLEPKAAKASAKASAKAKIEPLSPPSPSPPPLPPPPPPPPPASDSDYDKVVGKITAGGMTQSELAAFYARRSCLKLSVWEPLWCNSSGNWQARVSGTANGVTTHGWFVFIPTTREMLLITL